MSPVRFRWRPAPWILLPIAVAAFGRPAMAAEIVEDVRYEYPRVLGMWAAGENEAALESLTALERRLVAPGYKPDDVDKLWRAKLGVVRDMLGVVGPDVVVPVMMLHHDAYLAYRESGEPVLAAHSRLMAEELATFYIGRKEDPAARGVAGSLLTSLGGYLQHGWSWRHSAELFSLATQVWNESDAAHLGLGALYERRGEYPEAVEQLRAALAIRPDNLEARLRLGVCLRRSGDLDAARRAFEPLVAGGAPVWIELIAIEETADLLVRQGESPETVLREAVARYPHHSRLRVQLAHWLDRQGRGPEADGLLEEALLVFEPEVESPRYRYSRWPAERLEAIRLTLREAVDRLQPVLAAGVDSLQIQGAL
jgi:hypothetical protein